MIVRPAVHEDLPTIVDLAVESVSINPLPVVIDRKAMRGQAIDCMAPQNYLRVCEVDGCVVGAWAAVTHPSFWHERRVCSVLLHFSRTPGGWVRLARDFYRWVSGRGAIRVAVLELEPEADPRMVRLLKRIGFTRESTNVSYVRGIET
jgi:hypothetical protein